jgi:hypothetical protein
MLEKDNPLDQKLDATFRQKLDELDFPFREQDWQAMRQKIQTRQKRPVFWIAWIFWIGIWGVGKSYLPSLPALSTIDKKEQEEIPTFSEDKLSDIEGQASKKETTSQNLLENKQVISATDTTYYQPLTTNIENKMVRKDKEDTLKMIVNTPENYEKLPFLPIPQTASASVVDLKTVDSIDIPPKTYKKVYRLGIAWGSVEGIGMKQELLFHKHIRVSVGAHYQYTRKTSYLFAFPLELAYQIHHKTWGFTASTGILPMFVKKENSEAIDEENGFFSSTYAPTNSSNSLIYSKNKKTIGTLIGLGAEKHLNSRWLLQTQLQYRRIERRGEIGLRVGTLYQF